MARNKFSDQSTVEEAIKRVRSRLSPRVQSHFDLVINSLRRHLVGRSARFDAPYSKEWFTVKLVPTKAIIAFHAKKQSLEFDIDTYPDSGRDITDERHMFEVRPNLNKPNKVYVAEIDDGTSVNAVRYLISKMLDAINIFEAPQSLNISSRKKGD